MRRGGAPSWYDGGWPQDGKAWKNSPAGYREWSQGQGQEAASASTDGEAGMGP